MLLSKSNAAPRVGEPDHIPCSGQRGTFLSPPKARETGRERENRPTSPPGRWASALPRQDPLLTYAEDSTVHPVIISPRCAWPGAVWLVTRRCAGSHGLCGNDPWRAEAIRCDFPHRRFGMPNSRRFSGCLAGAPMVRPHGMIVALARGRVPVQVCTGAVPSGPVLPAGHGDACETVFTEPTGGRHDIHSNDSSPDRFLGIL